MRLLVVTQAVDQDDPVLGFFHEWLRALAGKFESIEVICLYEGAHELPSNVRVHSLGKEDGKKAKFAYARGFLGHVWRLRNTHDTVFVHMNQEYILIAGWLWKLLRKRMYLWRNHYAGSVLTDIAAAFCTKVFCTSKHSYTAKYQKTMLMPVGVDTDRFKTGDPAIRKPRSILFLARISPAKRVELLIEALGQLKEQGVALTATIVGSAHPRDEGYHALLMERAQELGLSESVSFAPGIPNAQAPALYQGHQIFVNTSPSGMFDKTLFEAAASGCIVLAASEDWRDSVGKEWWLDASDTVQIVGSLMKALDMPAQPLLMSQAVAENSLNRLVAALRETM